MTGDVGYGEILVFISVFCWVGSIIAADMGMDCTDGVSLTCVEFIMCAILNIIVAIVFEPAEWTSPYTNTKSNWQFILLVGVTEALAFLLSTVGQRYTSGKYLFASNTHTLKDIYKDL